MKRFKLLLVILISFAMILLPACQPEFKGGNFVDDLGRSVKIEKAPERIVSHVPAITEMVYALGLGDRLVGRCDYCNYPPEVTAKPSVGDYFNPSVENIVALEPDLVLTDGHSDSIKKLENLGITFFTIDPKTIDGVMQDIELLGKITGTEAKAQQVVDKLKQDIATVTDKVKNATKVRVLYAIDVTDPAKPWTAGPGSYIDAMINLSGGENVAAEATGAWVQFSIEAIVAADPELIVLPDQHGTAAAKIESLKQNPAWREITAVREDRFRTVESDLMDRNGPRITQGLQQVAQAVHPELFK